MSAVIQCNLNCGCLPNGFQCDAFVHRAIEVILLSGGILPLNKFPSVIGCRFRRLSCLLPCCELLLSNLSSVTVHIEGNRNHLGALYIKVNRLGNSLCNVEVRISICFLTPIIIISFTGLPYGNISFPIVRIRNLHSRIIRNLDVLRLHTVV